MATQEPNDRGQKLTQRDVRAIYNLCEEGTLTQWEIAHLFGVTQSMVSKIYNRRNWKDVVLQKGEGA